MAQNKSEIRKCVLQIRSKMDPAQKKDMSKRDTKEILLFANLPHFGYRYGILKYSG
jgi:hypothetical protein